MATSGQKLGWTLAGLGLLGCGVLLGKASHPTIGCDIGAASGTLTVTADEGPRSVRAVCQADKNGHPRVVLEIRP